MRTGARLVEVALLGVLGCAASACGTVAEGGGGDLDLPNAGAGPFRALVAGELANSRVPPNALEDDDELPRDPAVIDVDGDPATFDVHAYVAANVGAPGDAAAPPDTILRYDASDARSFGRTFVTVLEAAEAWEGGTASAPAIVARGGELLLYYAAAGGIGLARSADGTTFTRVAAPVLAPATEGWDAGLAPGSPGALVLADGSVRLFYEVRDAGGTTRIGEAASPDGVTFTRIGGAPVLAPGTASNATGDPPYDDGSVGDPWPVRARLASGDEVTRVYYAATTVDGTRTIGLAARFGDAGALDRATSPVFGSNEPFAPRAPCVLVYPGFSLLFVTQRVSRNDDQPSIAVAVAPATAALPPPGPL